MCYTKCSKVGANTAGVLPTVIDVTFSTKISKSITPTQRYFHRSFKPSAEIFIRSPSITWSRLFPQSCRMH